MTKFAHLNIVFFVLLFFQRSGIPQELVSVHKIGQLTGQPSMNNTGEVNVYGADLGIMFSHSNGKVYFLFGDTFGPPGQPGFSGDWRSNTMAFSSDTVASDGILFDGWITDNSGKARALIEGNHQPNDGNGEVTKIPTAGWSHNGRMYLWYMSISKWGEPGQWDVNYSEIAYSDDEGNSWTKSGLRWSSESNFVQFAVAEDSIFLYLWGIPAGRFGGVKLARVHQDSVLNQSAYQYFTGNGWSSREEDASLVVNSPVGELSVIWNQYLNRWMMTYFNESKACLYVRFSKTPEGPWGFGTKMACSNYYPTLYGAFMNEKYVENDGEIVYFLMSRYDVYNVFLMKAKFRKSETSVAASEKSFVPKTPILYQNYPNPFNGRTRLIFALPSTENVYAAIYNESGQLVKIMANCTMSNGWHSFIWDGRDQNGQILANGIYIIRLSTDRWSRSKKAILLK